MSNTLRRGRDYAGDPAKVIYRTRLLPDGSTPVALTCCRWDYRHEKIVRKNVRIARAGFGSEKFSIK